MSAEVWPETKGGMRLVKGASAPGYRTRILVVDRDPSAVAVVRSILRAQGWEVIHCKTAADALEKARLEGPDAVLTELDLPDMNGADLCRTLRQRAETASTPIIVLSASPGVAERVTSLRAGASDYLVKPPDAQELIARLKAALDLRKEKAGFVTAVLGSKGGVGTSMVAVNLAIALRHEMRAGVALIDAAMAGGAVDVMLNLQAPGGAGQRLPKFSDLEWSDFESILTPHVSGIQALLMQQQAADGINPEDLRRVLVALRKVRDFVVVDSWAVLDENTSTILEIADRVLLVLTPEITALRGARLFLEHANALGLPRDRVVPVLNRFPQRGGLQRRDVENALGMTVQVTIPDDVKLVTYSINRGVPLFESHARSGIARQVSILAKGLAKMARQ